MDYLPIFLRVQNRLAVVIGGGAVAARKAELLLKCGARVRLVAPELAAGTQALLRHPDAAQQMSHLRTTFDAQQLEGAALVIAATDSEAVNAQVSRLPPATAGCRSTWRTMRSTPTSSCRPSWTATR